MDSQTEIRKRRIEERTYIIWSRYNKRERKEVTRVIILKEKIKNKWDGKNRIEEILKKEEYEKKYKVTI